MTIQSYLQIENNIVTNNVMWDGDVNTWQPPSDATMLVTATTPALVWKWNFISNPQEWELISVLGGGEVEFTWDGNILTTNVPKPDPIVPPVVNGTIQSA